MVKKLIAAVVLLAMTGCTVNSDSIFLAEKVCEDHAGINRIEQLGYGPFEDLFVCNDSVRYSESKARDVLLMRIR